MLCRKQALAVAGIAASVHGHKLTLSVALSKGGAKHKGCECEGWTYELYSYASVKAGDDPPKKTTGKECSGKPKVKGRNSDCYWKNNYFTPTCIPNSKFVGNDPRNWRNGPFADPATGKRNDTESLGLPKGAAVFCNKHTKDGSHWQTRDAKANEKLRVDVECRKPCDPALPRRANTV